MRIQNWIKSVLLLLVLFIVGGSLAAWKYVSIQDAAAASAHQPEPRESVTVAVAREYEHRRATTSIGTVLALRSISLRNELPGTVKQVDLTPGQIVEPGTLLVAQDVSVEEAELKAHEAEAALAQIQLDRVLRASESHAVSDIEVDRARAERDVAQAQMARVKAIIDRKTIRSPFRARVGIADVHPGQYLEEGTLLTTLQGVDEASHVDFTVAQWVAAALTENDIVEISMSAFDESQPIQARIVALDSRIDPTTRNAIVRARIEGAGSSGPAPGASVRVRVPVGPMRAGIVVPASALRKGPDGDRVFVIEADDQGLDRAHIRPVQAGELLGDEIVILSGLVAGERVAAAGSFKLREGVLVAIKPDSTSVASAAQ